MKKLALLLTLLASFTVYAQGDAEAGKAKSATCAACHGADGNSLIAANPVLAGQHEKYLLKQLKDFKLGMTSGGAQGRNNAVMAGMVASLSEEDMSDLAAYFAAQTPKAGSTPESSIPVGEQLYLAGDKERGIAACIACHGPRGNGTALSGFPKISSQHADYIKSQLMAFRDKQRNNDMNGMMQIVASKLSDKEIEAISLYVGGLH
ncbi:c-type cytochrome [Enterovibrio norvegicus]|uniref:Cytochrome c553 n=2 Tax=Enterovibrio norvegicus TaxID=188144 RepID=A0A1I5RYZ4_9GAMM|nr:c-type cytochrome [Enterovibrio norvegicus]MCC4797467.1 cytochrome c4 [Enterovibrio norvegicus]OEE43736.1 cytochrome C [Enterovibrio norvegicus]OEF49121.1 cytochrome C [Enterovibrio norvegicus]OEF59942.1 cytochrome C [Enterovibrio norvegicus]PMH64664.1 cytochrome C [Enterovibrio norvegicus]